MNARVSCFLNFDSILLVNDFDFILLTRRNSRLGLKIGRVCVNKRLLNFVHLFLAFLLQHLLNYGGRLFAAIDDSWIIVRFEV